MTTVFLPLVMNELVVAEEDDKPMKPIVDISYWQQGIDYDKFANAISGAILRGAYGIWKDTMFETHYKELYSRGVPIGSYHYIIGNYTGLAQADIFNQVVAGKELKLGLWNDVEDRRISTGLNANVVMEYHGNIEIMTKRQVDIYTGQYAWYEIMGKYAYKYGDRKLWMSWPMASQPPMPIGSSWTTWLLWQYTYKGRIDGYYSDVDCNYFNNPEPPTPQPQPTGVTMKTLRPVNIRSEPSLSGAVVGLRPQGETVNVEAIHVTSTTSVWVKDSKGWSAVVHGYVQYMI